MLDIVDELRILAAKLDEQGIEYALCGGMAMGVHGHLRTTIDIDMLVLPQSLPQVLEVAGSLGYNIRGLDMDFRAVEIRRVSKIDPDSHDLLSLDFLLVNPEIQSVWDSRIQADWEHGILSVVSRQGLAQLKALRNSDQDALDIKILNAEESDAKG
jgi:hypothetical protein